MAIVAGETCGLAIRVARGLPDTATRRNSRKLATSRVAHPASDLRIRYPAIWRASAGTGRVLLCAARRGGPRRTAWTGITYLPRLCVLPRLCARTDLCQDAFRPQVWAFQVRP